MFLQASQCCCPDVGPSQAAIPLDCPCPSVACLLEECISSHDPQHCLPPCSLNAPLHMSSSCFSCASSLVSKHISSILSQWLLIMLKYVWVKVPRVPLFGVLAHCGLVPFVSKPQEAAMTGPGQFMAFFHTGHPPQPLPLKCCQFCPVCLLFPNPASFA